MASLYNIAVALNLQRLYNKTSDFDYEKGCQIFTSFDKSFIKTGGLYNVHCTFIKCALYNPHVITSKYIAKM